MFNRFHAISHNTFKVYEKYNITSYGAKEFRWEGESFNEVLIPISVIEAKSDKVIREYNPLLEATGLITELLKINIRDEKSILDFVSTFGLPADENLDRLINESIDSATIINNRQSRKANKNLRMKRFSEVERISSISFLWYEIGRNNSESIKHIVREFKQAGSEDVRFYEGWNAVENEEDIIKAKKFLFLKLDDDDKKKGRWSVDFAGKKPSLFMDFDDLFQVVIWQLANSIVNEIYFKKCKNCNNLFMPLHGHQKFCPPLLGRNTSTCQNTYNQRQKRKRKKIQ